MSSFVPDAGDVVWLEFSPQAGHEQRGRRPALVMSPALYNSKTGMMVCCPMTTKVKGYPFEVLCGDDGAVLSDQVKSLDWRARNAQRKSKAKPAVVAKVRTNLKTLLNI